MSSAGAVVGGVVGAVAGFFMGGPAGALYGAQIGIAVGGMLDPPKGPTLKGPRLSDLAQQLSSYGATIPRVYGTISMLGNVFWLENNQLKEVKTSTKSGGKGGESETTTETFSYYATFAVGLCKGPIVGVRRIWIGSKLVYDALDLDQGSIRASNENSGLFTIYRGDDTQLPDDRMQAALGVAHTPAYRGLAYIVMKDYPLADHGNSLMGAPVKVEIVANGSVDTYVQALSTTTLSAVAWTDIVWNGTVFCAVGNNGAYGISPDGLVWTQGLIGGSSGRNWRGVIWNGKTFLAWSDGNYPNVRTAISRDGVHWTVSGALPNPPWEVQCVGWHDSYFFTLGGSSCAVSYDGITWLAQSTLPLTGNWYTVAFNGNIWVSAYSDKLLTSPDGKTWTGHTSVPGLDSGTQWQNLIWNGSIFLLSSGHTAASAISTDGINWTSHPMPASPVGKGTCWTGEIFYNGGSGGIAYSSSDGINWSQMESLSAADCWGSAWNGAVIVSIYSNYYKSVVVYPTVLTIVSPSLSSIVRSECLLSNILITQDIDTSELTQSVRGYKVTSISTLTSSIEPLQAIYPFDVIQSGYTLKFKPRSSVSVATISASELAAERITQ